jgi:hypothetical protein
LRNENYNVSRKETKLAMRGENRVKVSDERYGGNYTLTRRLMEAPKILQGSYAKKNLWNKNINQKC